MKIIRLAVVFLVASSGVMGAIDYGDIQQAYLGLQSKSLAKILAFGNTSLDGWALGEANLGIDQPYFVVAGAAGVPVNEYISLMPHAGVLFLNQIGVSNHLYNPYGGVYASIPPLSYFGGFLGTRAMGTVQGVRWNLETGIIGGVDVFAGVSGGPERAYLSYVSGTDPFKSKYPIFQVYFTPSVDFPDLINILAQVVPLPDFSGLQRIGGDALVLIPGAGVPLAFNYGQDYFKTSYKEDWDLYADIRVFEKWEDRNYPFIKFRLGNMFNLLPGETFDKGFLSGKGFYLQATGVVPDLFTDDLFGGDKWGLIWGASVHATYGLGGAFGVVSPAPIRLGLYMAMNYPDDQSLVASNYSLFYMSAFVRISAGSPEPTR